MYQAPLRVAVGKSAKMFQRCADDGVKVADTVSPIKRRKLNGRSGFTNDGFDFVNPGYEKEQ